jgi:hypothetical protein
MPATSAETIISGAFDTVGILAPGESVSPADAQGALRRLNLMMSGLRLQPLTQPVVSREVFSLTSNIGVYTIGPGGDFDTTRPAANGFSGAGILLNSQGTPMSVTSLTRAGSVATATVTNHGASTGQNVTIRGADQSDYNGTFPITVTSVSTFTYLVDASVTTPATGTITASFESINSDATSITEVPRALLTDDAWQAIQIKSLTSAQFTNVYYNPTYAADLGTINLWPIPNTSVNSLVLYRLQPLTSFQNLTTEYFLPDGCEEALHYNLARRLLTPYGVTDQATVGDIIDMARTTLATFKRGNVKLSDLATDPALTANQRGGYNIVTGTGGGSSV